MPIKTDPYAHLRSYEPELNVLANFGKASRRLRQVERTDPASALVLELYYGDVGAKWGLGKGTRTYALYSLTKTGHKFVTRNPPDGGHADDVIAVEVHLQSVQPNDVRRMRLEKMQIQAEKMLCKAWDAWNATADKPKLKAV